MKFSIEPTRINPQNFGPNTQRHPQPYRTKPKNQGLPIDTEPVSPAFRDTQIDKTARWDVPQLQLPTSRRDFFVASALSLGGLPLIIPQQTRAADLSWVFPTAPEPILFPRKALDQLFAVLLMRSGYEVVDDLDFMPMDSFQVKFWKLRVNEQEAYTLQYEPIKIRRGDLTDPLYFDFISFIQYAVIGKEMPQGQQVFQEFCEECPNQRRLVRRDPALADNALLPARFYDGVGDKIYDGLLNGFRGEVFGAPAPLGYGASLEDVVSKVQQLLDIMVKRGYALKAQVVDVVDGPVPSFKVRVQGAANLWSLASLSYRRSPVVNAYEALVISAYLRASGRPSSYELSYSATTAETTFTLQPAGISSV